MSAGIILGERRVDLAADLASLRYEFLPGDMAVVRGELPPEGSAVRAIFRATAELLVADAAAMAAGSYQPRTTKERHHQAFLMLIERFIGWGPLRPGERDVTV